MGQLKKQKNFKKTKNGIILDQFKNQANPEIHFKTTKGMWNDTKVKLILLQVLEQVEQSVVLVNI